jgi:hypothetical protein
MGEGLDGQAWCEPDGFVEQGQNVWSVIDLISKDDQIISFKSIIYLARHIVDYQRKLVVKEQIDYI